MGLGHQLEKKIGALIILFSLLFSISLAQSGKPSDKEIVVQKSGTELEQEAIRKVEPEFPPIAKADGAPSMPSALYGLGKAYLKLGDKRSAMNEYRSLKKINTRQTILK